MCFKKLRKGKIIVLKFEQELSNIMRIFKASEAEIRPHFILTGPSGSGKSYKIAQLADQFGINFISGGRPKEEVNPTLFNKKLKL